MKTNTRHMNKVETVTIARHKGGFHLTVEAANVQGVETFHTNTIGAAIQIAFELIDPSFSSRATVGPLVLEHFSTKPCGLVGVEFYTADGTADVYFLYGGFCTDVYTVNANGTITVRNGGAL